MNLGENILNAFAVVQKTHENVKKLMEYIIKVAEEEGQYELVTPRFLRYKSDKDYSGWNLNSFVLAFQAREGRRMKNEWRNAPIYVVDICLYGEGIEEPVVTVAKFTYGDMKDWSSGVSPSSHYVFHEPLFSYKYEDKDDGISILEDSTLQDYWGLEKVERKEYPLVDVKRDNVRRIVFGTFDELKNLEEESE